MAEALRIVRLSQLAADAGYDSEPNHEFARDEHGMRTIIPAKHGRPTDKLPSGRYRRLMKVRFDRPAYRRRSQVETVISMIKRRQGAHVHGRSYHSQCRDLRLLVLTHNVMILVVVEVFYTAVLTPFLLELELDAEFLESERLETRLESQPVQPREVQLVLDPEYL